MSRKYKFQDNHYPYFVSFAVVNWIDVFIRNEYKNILLESWSYCMKKKGLILHAWCIMTSHVHLIISSNDNNLAAIMRDMKRHTATQMRKAIRENIQESRKEWMLWMMERAGKRNGNNNDFQFWQQHNQPIALVTNKMIDQRLDYLHYNLVEAGFVEEPEHYLYSSARDYVDIPGPVKIELI